MYLPSGFMFFEKVVGSRDFSGVRQQIFRDNDREELSELGKSLTALGCENPVLQHVLAAITNHS
eukprot:5771970-Karenia_brevis.AAC.1